MNTRLYIAPEMTVSFVSVTESLGTAIIRAKNTMHSSRILNTSVAELRNREKFIESENSTGRDLVQHMKRPKHGLLRVC